MYPSFLALFPPIRRLSQLLQCFSTVRVPRLLPANVPNCPVLFVKCDKCESNFIYSTKKLEKWEECQCNENKKERKENEIRGKCEGRKGRSSEGTHNGGATQKPECTKMRRTGRMSIGDKATLGTGLTVLGYTGSPIRHLRTRSVAELVLEEGFLPSVRQIVSGNRTVFGF